MIDPRVIRLKKSSSRHIYCYFPKYLITLYRAVLFSRSLALRATQAALPPTNIPFKRSKGLQAKQSDALIYPYLSYCCVNGVGSCESISQNLLKFLRGLHRQERADSALHTVIIVSKLRWSLNEAHYFTTDNPKLCTHTTHGGTPSCFTVMVCNLSLFHVITSEEVFYFFQEQCYGSWENCLLRIKTFGSLKVNRLSPLIKRLVIDLNRTWSMGDRMLRQDSPSSARIGVTCQPLRFSMGVLGYRPS